MDTMLTGIAVNDFRPGAQTPPHAVAFPPAAHRLGEQADWVVGVIDDELTARTASGAARRAGMASEDVLVLSGPEALKVIAAKEARMSPLMRLYALTCRLLTDPGCAESEYRQEASRGHALICLRASTPSEVERARVVMIEHDAHLVKHFGAWVLTELAK